MPGWWAYWANKRARWCVGVATLDRRDDRRGRLVVALEDVASDARQNQTPEQLGSGDRQTQQCDGAQREADRVHRTVGERIDDSGAEVGVRGDVVGFGRRTVPEQVDADDVTSGIGEQRGEAGRSQVVANEPPQPWTSTIEGDGWCDGWRDRWRVRFGDRSVLGHASSVRDPARR